jgi:hypothetical protein
MVSGIVRPPAIDLANRDLIEAHLHAVWLPESGQELAPDIPHVLDLNEAALPVQKDIASALADPALTARATDSMRRVLEAVKIELAMHSRRPPPQRRKNPFPTHSGDGGNSIKARASSCLKPTAARRCTAFPLPNAREQRLSKRSANAGKRSARFT